VAVQHVGLELPDQADDLRPDHEIGETRLAADGDATNPELQPRLDFGERRRGALAAANAVGDDADMVAALDLPVGKVQDVAKNPANGGAHDVQDAKRQLALGHDQNRRSPTNTVSLRPDSVSAEARDKVTVRTPRIFQNPEEEYRSRLSGVMVNKK
jgi:hypothetical protein